MDEFTRSYKSDSKPNQRIAPALTVDADAPLYDHGETADKPIPVPNASRTSDKAAAANAGAGRISEQPVISNSLTTNYVHNLSASLNCDPHDEGVVVLGNYANCREAKRQSRKNCSPSGR